MQLVPASALWSTSTIRGFVTSAHNQILNLCRSGSTFLTDQQNTLLGYSEVNSASGLTSLVIAYCCSCDLTYWCDSGRCIRVLCFKCAKCQQDCLWQACMPRPAVFLLYSTLLVFGSIGSWSTLGIWERLGCLNESPDTQSVKAFAATNSEGIILLPWLNPSFFGSGLRWLCFTELSHGDVFDMMTEYLIAGWTELAWHRSDMNFCL